MYSYLGSLDDAVLRLDPHTSPIEVLENAIVHAAYIGYPLLINDGYLLHEDIARSAFFRDRSILMDMIECKFVFVLSRNGGQIADVPIQKQHQVPSYKILVDRPDWPQIYRTLKSIEKSLHDHNAFLPWTKKDADHGFLELMTNELTKYSPESRGMAITKSALTQQIDDVLEYVKNFTKRGERIGARSAWEAVARTAFAKRNFNDYYSYLEMLELGNELYHYNHCLLMTNQEELNTNEVRLYTYYSNRLSHLRAFAAPAEQGFNLPILKVSSFATESELMSPKLLRRVVDATNSSNLYKAKSDYQRVLDEPSAFGQEEANTICSNYSEMLKQLWLGRAIKSERPEAMTDVIATSFAGLAAALFLPDQTPRHGPLANAALSAVMAGSAVKLYLSQSVLQRVHLPFRRAFTFISNEIGLGNAVDAQFTNPRSVNMLGRNLSHGLYRLNPFAAKEHFDRTRIYEPD